MLVAFVAGMIDAIAGGGGLITLPALLLAGASPLEALSTNKVQGSFGSGTAAFAYAARGHVRLRDQLGWALVSCLAAAMGAGLVTVLPADLLQVVLPVILIGIAVFFAVKPGLDDVDRRRRLAPLAFGLLVVPPIAFYDGLVGPGTGAFFMLAFVTLAGFGLLKATAHTKFLNFASNLGSLAVFAIWGAPWWLTGLAMGLAQVAGAMLGARLAMRVGARLIRPLLVISASALALRALWDAMTA
ncbi:MAG: TSUP family transporter [Roseinatronobacter sp.]